MEQFREVQYCSWWVYVILLGVLLALVWTYQSFGSVLPLILMVLLVLIAVLALRLETVVRQDELTAHFGWLPVVRKRIPLTDVLQVEAASYRPLRQFGGWGWRFGRGGVYAFTAQGSSEVCLVLRSGTRYLIGSSRSNELAGVLQRCISDG
jgi:hypothetical protein